MEHFVSPIIILLHKALFQGMFIAKNLAVRRKAGKSIRGKNREATVSIVFYTVFILVSIGLSWLQSPFGSVGVPSHTAAAFVAAIILCGSLLISAAALVGLKDSWRVGIPDQERTPLIEQGVYRFSRNPYFLAYILSFLGYAVLLQNLVILFLAAVGTVITHFMTLSEERHLTHIHGQRYASYKKRVPRYILF